MFTASAYDAKRTGSDGKNYNTIFNGEYILNALGSKEFKWGVKRNSSFTIGGKITLAGGKRYTPIDIAVSDIAGEAVYIDSLRNTMQFNPYFRLYINLVFCRSFITRLIFRCLDDLTSESSYFVDHE